MLANSRWMSRSNFSKVSDPYANKVSDVMAIKRRRDPTHLLEDDIYEHGRM